MLVNPLFHSIDNGREPTLKLYGAGGLRRFAHACAGSEAESGSSAGISKDPSGHPSFFHCTYVPSQFVCLEEEQRED